MTSGVPALDALTIELTRPRTDTVLARVHGTLDGATAPVLDSALQRQLARRLVLDLSDAEFLGVPGVTVLVRARRRTEAVAGTDPPCLVGLSAAGTRMLGLVGARDLFDIHDSVDAALTGSARQNGRGNGRAHADDAPPEGTTR